MRKKTAVTNYRQTEEEKQELADFAVNTGLTQSEVITASLAKSKVYQPSRYSYLLSAFRPK